MRLVIKVHFMANYAVRSGEGMSCVNNKLFYSLNMTNTVKVKVIRVSFQRHFSKLSPECRTLSVVNKTVASFVFWILKMFDTLSFHFFFLDPSFFFLLFVSLFISLAPTFPLTGFPQPVLKAVKSVTWTLVPADMTNWHDPPWILQTRESASQQVNMNTIDTCQPCGLHETLED